MKICGKIEGFLTQIYAVQIKFTLKKTLIYNSWRLFVTSESC